HNPLVAGSSPARPTSQNTRSPSQIELAMGAPWGRGDQPSMVEGYDPWPWPALRSAPALRESRRGGCTGASAAGADGNNPSLSPPGSSPNRRSNSPKPE